MRLFRYKNSRHPKAIAKSAWRDVQIINCHAHLFTHEHTPDRFLAPGVRGWIAYVLAQYRPTRRFLIALFSFVDPHRRHKAGRYGEILATTYDHSQPEIFEIVRGFYPIGTRFVVLPMNMMHMRNGSVAVEIEDQHAELARLRVSLAEAGEDVLLPFVALDPRDEGDVFAKTVKLIKDDGFCGLKLYPPTGYHPNDSRLRPIYEYAAAEGIPVLSHCSRPAQVQYRGKPDDEMQWDPDTNTKLALSRADLLTFFTSPDAYRVLMKEVPGLRICLAHFGGSGDWNMYLQHPWGTAASSPQRWWTSVLRRDSASLTPQRPEDSWLTKILEMIRSGDFPNLWTDISYTVFDDDEYVYLLKVILSDPRIREKVLFGSDFYVVENAHLDERRRSVRVRAVLGEDLFRTIAETNPRTFLGLH